ncbi:MAG: NifU family protein [Deltaproteobacteria bacterium]|nr:NifU family protein [Deltaproteobacteria bacterium]
MSEPLVKVVPTPNPDAYMFRVFETLVSSGTYEFVPDDDISMSPLAQKLFEIDEIALILITPRFITIRKLPEKDWTPLTSRICEKIVLFLSSSEMAIYEAPKIMSTPERSPLEQKIIALLDEEIRPAIAQDGGDLIYHGFEDGIVRLELIGACGTCPSSTMTLQHGIQNLLIEEIPEVLAVESV